MTLTGQIEKLVGTTYGFIQTESNESYYFRSSAFVGLWSNLKRGDHVQFEPDLESDRPRAKRVELAAKDTPPERQDSGRHRAGQGRSGQPRTLKTIPPYTGKTLGLTDEQRKQALSDISHWKLEARLDDIKRYFYTVPELRDITTGAASYVIGRKGTGKTALVQYLSEQSGDGLLVKKLTFKNFPFNELYAQTNDGYRRPNQYITIWKLIIYSSACQLIAESEFTDPLIRQIIEKAFPPPNSDNLGTIIGKWIAGDFGVNVLGTGLNVSKWFKDKKPYTLQDKVENLEQFVRKHVPRQTLLVLFDELDEDYKDMFKDYNKSEYLDLLTSLFKAVQDVRAVLSGTSICLFPVIFLRDDIYDLIQDSDKNKWRDLEVDLKWTDEEIRALLAHRLSKVMATTTEDFDVLWYSIFSSAPFLYAGGYKEINSFDYIKMSAQRRPRDYINYLQECASIELKRTGTEISADTIRDADKAYSNYLKKEMIDEIHGIIPDIARVLAIFSESRKWILSVDEFRVAYQERVKAKSMAIDDVDFVLQTLFYFSVIGNVVRTDFHVFRHERPDAQLNFKEKIVVHRGLMKALQIL
jgi:Cdc6-like AAA superfamily ATPase